MSRLKHREDVDRSFDIEFWQRLGDAAIFAAAWDMVVLAHKFKGRNASELTFQRTLKKIQRTSGLKEDLLISKTAAARPQDMIDADHHKQSDEI